MTLRKDDIELLNKISEGQVEGLSSTTEDVMLYRRILDGAASWECREGRSEKEVFAELMDRMSMEESPAQKSRRFGMKSIMMIAASLSILLVATFLLINSLHMVNVKSEVAEVKEINLPDGSMVVLNADSRISYDKEDWENGQRTVELRGQAFFKVVHGSRFSVNGQHGSVAVLGTSFNVYDRADGFHVECFTGKVEVTTKKSSSKVYLTKGLKTIVEDLKMPELTPPVQFEMAKQKEWMSGTFNFYNTPVSQVLSEVERQFGVEISLQNDEEEKRYTGTFNKEDLERALMNVCKPLGFEYEILDNEQILIIN